MNVVDSDDYNSRCLGWGDD